MHGSLKGKWIWRNAETGTEMETETEAKTGTGTGTEILQTHSGQRVGLPAVCELACNSKADARLLSLVAR